MCFQADINDNDDMWISACSSSEEEENIVITIFGASFS